MSPAGVLPEAAVPESGPGGARQGERTLGVGERVGVSLLQCSGDPAASDQAFTWDSMGYTHHRAAPAM
jgi:hypothetical protein